MNKLIASTSCDREGTFHGLKAAIETSLAQGAKSLFVLSCEGNDISAGELNDYLGTVPVPLFGGIFPRIVHGSEALARGHIVCGFSRELSLALVPLDEHKPNLWRTILQSRCAWLEQCHSLIALIDGLSPHIDAFIDLLYNHIGPDRPVVGGGAGSLELVQKPCLLTNEGLVGNAAVIAGLPLRSRVGVRHGWQQMAGPFLVTKSDGNVIHTLNYEPAFQVYRETIESCSDKRFSDHDFFSIAKTYPFGMEKLDEEILIRDPIAEREGSLVCVGGIPEHAMVYIMQGNVDTLMNAARQVTERFPLEEATDLFVFDCISRQLFLGERFNDELALIGERLPEESHMVGALTLGEIASSRWGPIQFLNKTIVVSTLQGE